MPDEKKGNSSILVGAAAAGAAGAAGIAASRRLEEKARQRTIGEAPKPLDRQRQRLDRLRSEATNKAVRAAERHPRAQWADRQFQQNPVQMRKAVKQGRLKRARQKAAGRTPKLGVLGVVVGIPGALMDAVEIEREGGSRAARFGKFVERALGMPPGVLDRPLTDKEKDALLSI